MSWPKPRVCFLFDQAMAQELSEGGEVAAQQCLEEWLQRQLHPSKETGFFFWRIWIFVGEDIRSVDG